MQAQVTGGTEPPDVAGARAVALVPDGWPPGEGNVVVAIEGDVSLPLLVLWPAGVPPAAVQRLRERMSTTA